MKYISAEVTQLGELKTENEELRESLEELEENNKCSHDKLEDSFDMVEGLMKQVEHRTHGFFERMHASLSSEGTGKLGRSDTHSREHDNLKEWTPRSGQSSHGSPIRTSY